MYETRKLDLQLFSEGGEGGAAGSASEGGGSAADVQIGDVLPDGTIVDEDLASSMRENPDMYRNLPMQEAHAQAPSQEQVKQSQGNGQVFDPATMTREQWDALKKQIPFYGEDVHNAVNDRFKNSKDATTELEAAQKRLNEQSQLLTSMMKQMGLGSIEELAEHVRNIDLEAEAEEQDMTVEQLRAMKELKAQNEQMTEAMLQEKNKAHIAGLFQQAEELKKIFPDFDLTKELQNPEFVEMTSPAGKRSVAQAFMALHGMDLMSQIAAMGVHAGQQQTAKAIQANARRPVEGASRGGGRSGGNVQPNSSVMTEEEYDRIRAMTMQGNGQTL